MGILDESVEPESFLEAPSKVQYLLELLNPIISKILVALIIILIGFIVGKLIGKTVHWILRTAGINMFWKEITGLDWRMESYISSILSGGIYFIVIVMALNVLELSQFLVKLIGFGVIVIIIISFLLAIKDFVPNYINGFRIHKRVKIKDRIIIDGIKATVEDITWTDTKVCAENGDVIYIPNILFIKKGFRHLK